MGDNFELVKRVKIFISTVKHYKNNSLKLSKSDISF